MRLASLMLVPLLPLSAQQIPSAASQTDRDVQAYVPRLTPLNRTEGVLPDSARSQGIQGMVRMLAIIDSQGLVTNVEALAGPEVLRKPAMDTVRQWKFQPVIRDGHPVVAYTDALVNFFVPGKPPSSALNMAEELAAAQRILEIQRRFPRSKDQVLADLEQDISGVEGQQRFYALTRLSKAAWDAGAIAKAESYAEELLSQARQNQRDWNYGNAIHDGNMVLGLVALRNGNLVQSREYLLEAGKTPGSPNLNSFGPNMTLAKELLQKAEKDPVLEYFSLCRAFWKMGGAKLDEWSATVRGGGIPSFGANLSY
jgi:TonB family protein